MLNTIREGVLKNKMTNTVECITEEKEMNFVQEADYLMSRSEKQNINESDESNSGNNEFVIAKNTPQFGDVFESQTSALLKTIGENIEFGEKALVYYKDKKDLTLSGKIKSLNVAFQYRYNDPSGEGVYLWVNGGQLTESNLRTIGKIRDAFVNWKQGLVQNADLIEKLDKVSKKS